MEAWMQEDFQPVAQDDNGNDIYSYVCIAYVNEQELQDLCVFLEEHGVPTDIAD